MTIPTIPGSLRTLIELCQYGPDAQFGAHPARTHGVLNRNENMHNAMERNLSTCSDMELIALLSDLDTLREYAQRTLLDRADVHVECDACRRSGDLKTFRHHPDCMLAPARPHADDFDGTLDLNEARVTKPHLFKE